ncbi:energy transducer TonB [Novosphingobium soli]|uniref:Energy transducer TonB n=1 Tax=Novosphingobium soli TaxID=574956 RepID=A0ABV6CX21_9SPHN
MQRIVISSFALMASAAVPALAETKVVTATSPWKVDSTGNACHLQRGFGTVEDPLLVQFEQLAPGDTFNFTTAGRSFSGITEATKVTLTTGPDGLPISTRVTLGDMQAGNGQKLTTLFFMGTTLNGHGDGSSSPARVTPEREAKVTSLIVSWGGKSVQIGTGPLGKAFAALDGCTEGLVRSWGFDPAQQASLSRWPKPLTDPDTWLPRGSYPSDLAREGEQSLVDVRLMIDPAGAVSDCVVVNGFNEARFAKVTCDKIRERAKFEPALDAAGNPVASYAVRRVKWVVDRKPRMPVQRRR